MTVKKVSEFSPAVGLSPSVGFGPNSDLSLREAGRRFINSYRAAGYSASYVQTLEETIGYLAHFSEERRWPPISQITTQHLEEYFAYSRTRKKGYGERKVTGNETLSSSYLDKQFRSLHRFWACMVEARWAPVHENVLRGMQRPRVEEKIVPTVPDEHIADLLSLVNPKLAQTRLDTFRLTRNNAVIHLFVDTPGRRTEISTMKVADVMLEEEKVQVMGKGRRQRYMPIGRAAQRALEEYLDARDMVYPVSDDLWVAESGEGMEPDWVYQLIARLRERANIPRLHPHMFRHTYAIKALRSGMPEQILKIIGGWRKIPETYFRTLGYEDAAAFHRTMSPGDQIMRQAPARKRSERRKGGPRARGQL